MLTRYWFCTVNEDNWHVIKRELIWGVSRKFKSRVEKMSVGDKIVFYVTPASIGGIFEVVTPVFEDSRKIFVSGKIFPYRVKLRPLIVLDKPISFKPLILKLRFIRNKERWAAYIRLPVREIPADDYDIILHYIESSVNVPR